MIRVDTIIQPENLQEVEAQQALPIENELEIGI